MYFNVRSEFKACLYLFLSFSLLFIPLCRWPTICYIIAYEIIHLFFISQPSCSTVHEKTNLSATSSGFLGLQPELRKSTLKCRETSVRSSIEPQEGCHKYQISTSTAFLTSMKLSSKGATECLVPNSDSHSHLPPWLLTLVSLSAILSSLAPASNTEVRGILLSSVDIDEMWCHLACCLLSLSIASITLYSKHPFPPLNFCLKTVYFKIYICISSWKFSSILIINSVWITKRQEMKLGFLLSDIFVVNFHEKESKKVRKGGNPWQARGRPWRPAAAAWVKVASLICPTWCRHWLLTPADGLETYLLGKMSPVQQKAGF